MECVVRAFAILLGYTLDGSEFPCDLVWPQIAFIVTV